MKHARNHVRNKVQVPFAVVWRSFFGDFLKAALHLDKPPLGGNITQAKQIYLFRFRIGTAGNSPFQLIGKGSAQSEQKWLFAAYVQTKEVHLKVRPVW